MRDLAAGETSHSRGTWASKSRIPAMLTLVTLGKSCAELGVSRLSVERTGDVPHRVCGNPVKLRKMETRRGQKSHATNTSHFSTMTCDESNASLGEPMQALATPILLVSSNFPASKNAFRRYIILESLNSVDRRNRLEHR